MTDVATLWSTTSRVRYWDDEIVANNDVRPWRGAGDDLRLGLQKAAPPPMSEVTPVAFHA